jgi:hypothetical protein
MCARGAVPISVALVYGMWRHYTFVALREFHLMIQIIESEWLATAELFQIPHKEAAAKGKKEKNFSLLAFLCLFSEKCFLLSCELNEFSTRRLKRERKLFTLQLPQPASSANETEGIYPRRRFSLVRLAKAKSCSKKHKHKYLRQNK